MRTTGRLDSVHTVGPGRIANDWESRDRPRITAYQLTVTVAGEHELRLAEGSHSWTL